MDTLPCEIKLAILDYLDRHGNETANWHTTSKSDGPPSTTLKSLSRVSRSWHCLVRPRLLSRVVIHVNQEEHFRGKGGSNSSDATRFRQALKVTGAGLVNSPIGHRHTGNNAHLQVDSLAVKVDDSFMTAKAMRDSAQHSIDILTICEFWRRVFDEIDPLALKLIAPVTVLGWLTVAVPEMADAWAFPDMTVQVLQLSQERHTVLPTTASTASHRNGWDTEYLFNARPWHSIALNEGSMLKAYDSYEYYSKHPPSVIRALVFPRSDRITSFSSHVLFPFNTHIASLQLISLSYYKHVHFHFSPWPNAHILADRAVVGHAHLDDCWRETEQVYRRAVSHDPLSPLFANGSAMREFSTGDYEVDSIRELLDDAFKAHAKSGWRSVGSGRWAVVGELQRADSGVAF